MTSILGAHEVQINLDKFNQQTQKRIQSLLEAAGTMCRDDTSSMTPVDTGYLQSRNQIDIKPGVVTVFNDATYAPPVELGHLTRSGSFVAPQPYMTPAFINAATWLEYNYRVMSLNIM
jgi:Bacteriophage HK97-gp10, putative tail-component